MSLEKSSQPSSSPEARRGEKAAHVRGASLFAKLTSTLGQSTAPEPRTRPNTPTGDEAATLPFGSGPGVCHADKKAHQRLHTVGGDGELSTAPSLGQATKPPLPRSRPASPLKPFKIATPSRSAADLDHYIVNARVKRCDSGWWHGEAVPEWALVSWEVTVKRGDGKTWKLVKTTRDFAFLHHSTSSLCKEVAALKLTEFSYSGLWPRCLQQRQRAEAEEDAAAKFAELLQLLLRPSDTRTRLAAEIFLAEPIAGASVSHTPVTRVPAPLTPALVRRLIAFGAASLALVLGGGLVGVCLAALAAFGAAVLLPRQLLAQQRSNTAGQALMLLFGFEVALPLLRYGPVDGLCALAVCAAFAGSLSPMAKAGKAAISACFGERQGVVLKATWHALLALAVAPAPLALPCVPSACSSPAGFAVKMGGQVLALVVQFRDYAARIVIGSTGPSTSLMLDSAVEAKPERKVVLRTAAALAQRRSSHFDVSAQAARAASAAAVGQAETGSLLVRAPLQWPELALLLGLGGACFLLCRHLARRRGALKRRVAAVNACGAVLVAAAVGSTFELPSANSVSDTCLALAAWQALPTLLAAALAAGVLELPKRAVRSAIEAILSAASGGFEALRASDARVLSAWDILPLCGSGSASPPGSAFSSPDRDWKAHRGSSTPES